MLSEDFIATLLATLLFMIQFLLREISIGAGITEGFLL